MRVRKDMKIKDLDYKTLDLYCTTHECEHCPLFRIVSKERYLSCVGALKSLKERPEGLIEIDLMEKE